MDTPTQILTTGECRVFHDPDGYELVEIGFSNGSKVLMHFSQYHAIVYETASSTKNQGDILALHESLVKRDRKREADAAVSAQIKRQKVI